MLGLWLMAWAPIQLFLTNLLLTFFSITPIPAPAGLREMVQRSAEGDRPSIWIVAVLAAFALGWTYAGVSTVTHLFRLHVGSDHLVITNDFIRSRRAFGPFTVTRELKREDIGAIVLHGRARRLDAMLIEGKRVVLATLGDVVARRELATDLRSRFRRPPGSGLPRGWQETRQADGTVELRGPRGGQRFLIGCIVLFAAIWFGLIAFTFYLKNERGQSLEPTTGNWIAIAIGIAMLTPIAAVARLNAIIEARPNSLRAERRIFRDATLHLVYDQFPKYGDAFGLEVRSGGEWSSLAPQADDPADLLLLGRFLAEATGWRLEVASQAE